LKTVKPVKDALKEGQLMTRLNEIHPKYRILWRIGSATGLRVSDILPLLVRDIKPSFDVKESKTKKIRRITLTPAICAEIALYALKTRLEPYNYLIPGRGRNRPLNRVQAWRVIKQAAADIGLESIGSHSMRKTYANTLFTLTGDAVTVQKALNHKYLETTMRYLGKKMIFVDE
jgi:integrase